MEATQLIHDLNRNFWLDMTRDPAPARFAARLTADGGNCEEVPPQFAKAGRVAGAS